MSPRETVGISPKASWATIVPIALGTVLLVVGLIIGNTELVAVGLGLVTGGPIAGAAAYKASPGRVVVKPRP